MEIILKAWQTWMLLVSFFSAVRSNCGVYFPDPSSCSYYVIKWNNQVVRQPCAHGLHWNPVVCACSYPNPSICVDATTTAGGATKTTAPTPKSSTASTVTSSLPTTSSSSTRSFTTATTTKPVSTTSPSSTSPSSTSPSTTTRSSTSPSTTTRSSTPPSTTTRSSTSPSTATSSSTPPSTTTRSSTSPSTTTSSSTSPSITTSSSTSPSITTRSSTSPSIATSSSTPPSTTTRSSTSPSTTTSSSTPPLSMSPSSTLPSTSSPATTPSSTTTRSSTSRSSTSPSSTSPSSTSRLSTSPSATSSSATSSPTMSPMRTSFVTTSSSTTGQQATRSPALNCNLQSCRLPNCSCAVTSIPGGLGLADVPQIVMLTMDDGVNALNANLYTSLFDGKLNPNNCPQKMTLFVSGDATDYAYVRLLRLRGHEIADHSLTHRYPTTWWKDATYDELAYELVTMRNNLLEKAGASVTGYRNPFLQTAGDRLFSVLADQGFLYDTSLPLGSGQMWWPYTLEYLPSRSKPCAIPPCPTYSYRGLWEVPMSPLTDYVGIPCSMFDACYRTPNNTKEAVYDFFMENFRRFHAVKAPFPLFGHSSYFAYGYRKLGFEDFINDIRKMPDVYFVSVTEAIRWVQQPTKLSDLARTGPWTCS